MAYRETDPVSQTSDAGNTPRDPRPMIVKLIEIEAIPEDKRTLLEVEALGLWQSELGGKEERIETCTRFIRPGGQADRFFDFLQACNLAEERAAILAIIDKAIEYLGGPRAPDERKTDEDK